METGTGKNISFWGLYTLLSSLNLKTAYKYKLPYLQRTGLYSNNYRVITHVTANMCTSVKPLCCVGY